MITSKLKRIEKLILFTFLATISSSAFKFRQDYNFLSFIPSQGLPYILYVILSTVCFAYAYWCFTCLIAGRKEDD